MKKSDTIATLAGALAKAQGQFPAIERTSKVDFTTKSGAKIKYSYAPLPDIIKACKKPLSDNELSVMQHIWTRGKDERVVIETVLCHSSGEWVSSSFTMTGTANDPQAMGSLITYGRRYGLSSILGVSADEDDDALSQKAEAPAQFKPPMKDGSPLNQPPGKPPEKSPTQEHWCKEHDTEFFMKGKMKSFAHPVKDSEDNQTYDGNGKPLWCQEHTPEPSQSTQSPTKGEYSSKPPEAEIVAPTEPETEVPEPKEITYIGQKEHLPMGEYEGQELTIVETEQVIVWHQSDPNTGRWLGKVAPQNAEMEAGLNQEGLTMKPEPVTVTEPEEVPADMQAFLTWVSSHGKKYGPTWLSNQFHVTPDDLKDDTLRAKLYADVKTMMNW